MVPRLLETGGLVSAHPLPGGSRAVLTLLQGRSETHRRHRPPKRVRGRVCRVVRLPGRPRAVSARLCVVFFRHQIYAIIFPPPDFSRQLFAVGILPRVFRRQIFTAKFPPWDVSLAFVTSWRAACGDFAPVAPLVGVAAPPRDRAHKIRHAVLQPGARSRGPGRLYRGRCAGGGQRSIYTVSGQTLDLMHNIAN